MGRSYLKGKTYEEYFGKVKAEAMRKNQSKQRKGRKCPWIKRILPDKICKECSVLFRPRGITSLFCSRDCWRGWIKKNPSIPSKRSIEKFKKNHPLKDPKIKLKHKTAVNTVEHKRIVSDHSKKRWQNKDYRSKMINAVSGRNSASWKGGPVESICNNCEVKFKANRRVVKRNNKRFCSVLCYQEWWGQNMVFPIKDTTIEVKIQNYLKDLEIEFLTHQYMKIEHSYKCDIFIPSKNLIIECDGDYWHGNPKLYSDDKLRSRILLNRGVDNLRTKELLSKGYNVMRLWENEIKVLNLEDFKEALNKYD